MIALNVGEFQLRDGTPWAGCSACFECGPIMNPIQGYETQQNLALRFCSCGCFFKSWIWFDKFKAVVTHAKVECSWLLCVVPNFQEEEHLGVSSVIE